MVRSWRWRYPLVLAAMALAASGAFAQALDPSRLPVFPWSEPRIRVLKSDVDVGFTPKFYWIDDETVVFPGRPFDPKASLQKRKELPLHIVRWHVPTNRITYGHAVDDQFCYSRDGNVSFVLYQRTDGVPDIRRGYFVEDRYFGPIDAPRKLEGGEKDAFKRGIDDWTCGPAREEARAPEWIDPKQYSPRPVGEGWVLRPHSAQERPRYCGGSAQDIDHCPVLPFPPGVSPGWTYVEHLQGWMLMGHFAGPRQAYATLVKDGQTRAAWRVLPNARSGGPMGAVFTRVGLIEVQPQVGPFPPGLFHLRNDARPLLVRTHLTLAFEQQRSVSPDGCQLPIAASNDGMGPPFRAWMISLCE